MATFRAGNSLAAATRTNSTINKPTGLAVGDELCFLLIIENDVVPSAVPTGMTPGIYIDNVLATHDLYVWSKIAVQADVDATSFTVSHASSWTEGFCWAVQNPSATIRPWFGVANQPAAASTTRLAPGVTPVGNDACVMFIGGSFTDHGTVSPPTNFTERHDNGTNLYVASRDLASGSQADASHTITSAAWEAVLMVVEDDGTTSGSPPAYIAATGDLFAAASGTSITPVLPPSIAVQADDVMVFPAMCNGSTTFSTPTDWAVLGTAVESNANQSSEWYWKRHDGSESNPTSTTSATLSTTLGGYGRIFVIRGALTASDPFEDVTMAGNPTASTTPASAAIDTTDINRLVVAFAVVDDDNTWASGMPPANWYNPFGRLASTTGGDAMYDGIALQKPTAGAVASVTIGTMSASDTWRTITFALIPEPVSGGPPPVTGQAAAAFGYTATAAGVPRTPGQAAGSFGGTFTAAGVPRTPGTAATAFGGTFTAAGVDRAVGVATGTFGGTFTASGVTGAPPVTGQAAAAFGGTFTAAGVDRAVGQAVVSFGYTATANGIDRAVGQAVVSFGGTFTANGIDRAVGQAVATFGYTATASGVRRARGVAAVSFGGTFTAFGVTGAPPKTGQAVALFGGTFTAAGIDRAVGQAIVSFGFVAASSGVRDVHGAGVATYAGTFTATGTVQHIITGHAVADFGGTFTVSVVTYTITLVATGTNRYRATSAGAAHTATPAANRYLVET